ncbi:protein NLRC5-like isoform X1 [Oncorhynchus nerka]|uniref:protein NLRC5-like isoform X1 n=1 Tax=Oncorhynchus nerka TaxID=8023 RepID=UPI0031B83999
MILTSFLSVCPDVVQVDISLTGCALRLPHLDRLCENLRDCSALTMLENMSEVNIRIQSTGLEQCKKLSLTHSDIHPTDMNKLCRRLVQCPSLLELDFSHGSLKDDAIENLLKILPKMKSLQLLNMSHVQMSTDGALLLVRSLIDCHRVRAVELRAQ